MMRVRSVETIVVRTALDPVVVDPQPVGQDVEDVFRLTRDEKGNRIYTKVGEKNVREYIESFKNGCALSAILSRISLMPTRDKVSYLQQNEGVSADMSAMPTDGTAAFIQLQKYANEYPQVFERIAKGEDISTILADVFKQDAEPPKTPEPTEPKEGES